MKTIDCNQKPILKFIWPPEEESIRREAIDNAFADLAGESPAEFFDYKITLLQICIIFKNLSAD